MKKITLKQIIYKNYLKTTLTSILFIELALLILYFTANNNILEKSTKLLITDVRESVYDRVKVIKHEINNSFKNIENTLALIQSQQENFFKQIDNLEVKTNAKFEHAKNGMYYKVNDNGGSSVIVSKDTLITTNLQKELEKTETLDKSLKIGVENNNIVIAGYYNSKYNYSRYYPYIVNSYDTFPEDLNMQNYNFFYEADLKHNPEKKIVWTDVYLDPVGYGWMFSAIAPIYKNDVLEGVLGFDITINKVIDKFLSFKMPYNGSSFIIDNNIEIIAMTKKIATILKIKNDTFDEYKSNEKISNTIYRKDKEPFIIKYKELSKTLKEIVSNKKYKDDIFIDDEKYFIFSEKIDKLPWYTITLVKEDDVLADVKSLENEYIFLGFMIIIFIVLFYLLFFIYLYKKANDLVYRINKPLLKVVSLTKILGKSNHYKVIDDCGIVEIDKLSKNFNNLSKELLERTKELVEVEASRALHEKLSNTDSLTNVYNRRFLEDFSKKYFEIVKREKSTLSILLVDIDDFKNINDGYGHDVGDQVLINLVNMMKERIRENDFIVRLGGDEFLILLPNSDLNGAKIVAQKLINSMHNSNFDDDKKFTISIGCSEYNIDDKDIECMIKRADESLYNAKKAGKNQVC